MKKKTAKKKKRWISPEISKVALHPEQAVLSCCDAVDRQQLTVGRLCYWDIILCGTAASAPSS